MEKTKNKSGNIILRLGILIVVYVLFILVVIALDLNSLNKSLKAVQTKRIEDDMVVYGTRISREIKYLGKGIDPVEELLTSGAVSEKEALDALRQGNGVKRAAFLDETGSGQDTEGAPVSIDMESFKGSFKKGKVNYLYLGEGRIAAVAAVEARGKKLRYLMLEYDEAGFNDLFFNFSYGRDTWMAVADEKGRILYLYSGKNADENLQIDDNLYERVYAVKNSSIIRMQDNISRNKSGVAQADLGGGGRQIFYRPLEINEWYLIMGVPDSYIALSNKANERLINGMLLKIIAGTIVFVAFIVGAIVRDRIGRNVKNKELLKLAERDQLTGLFNKVTTEKKIREYLTEHPDSQSCFFILDIDNFKKINDTMGHAFGDEVLRAIGERIKMDFRASDIIGRVGGDEFIILLKGLKTEEIIIKEAKKVERFFKEFRAGTYVKYSATASIGCAIFPADGDTFESLYKAADSALYQAKKRGKNQLAFYKEPEGFRQSV